MSRPGSRLWQEASIFVACLLIVAAIVGFGVYFPFAPKDPPAPPGMAPEERRQAFMERLNEHAGIERIEGRTVKVGPKFVALAPEEKESFLNVLAAQVFEVPTDGTLRPDQSKQPVKPVLQG
jgi:hypothetical protein